MIQYRSRCFLSLLQCACVHACVRVCVVICVLLLAQRYVQMALDIANLFVIMRMDAYNNSESFCLLLVFHFSHIM